MADRPPAHYLDIGEDKIYDLIAKGKRTLRSIYAAIRGRKKKRKTAPKPRRSKYSWLTK